MKHGNNLEFGASVELQACKVTTQLNYDLVTLS